MMETSLVAELQDLLSSFVSKRSTSITERLRRVSEHTGEMQSLVGLRNNLASAITRLQVNFIDKLASEYPSRHNLVDTRKRKTTQTLNRG